MVAAMVARDSLVAAMVAMVARGGDPGMGPENPRG